MDHLGPGRAAGEVAAGRNLDAAADQTNLPDRGRNPDVAGTAAGDQTQGAAADQTNLPDRGRNPDVAGDQTQGAAVHRNQDGKDDGTRGISFPWDHNIP